MDRREVESKLVNADARRREARERLEQNAARLAELDDERAALVGESRLAERAAADYEEHLTRLRAELAAVEVSEARAAVRGAIEARDARIAEAAAAVSEVLAALERTSSARAELQKAHHHLRTIDADAPKVLPPEPTVFDDRWQRLAPLIEAELGVRLESELLDAAARSANPRAIDDLPEHLRELARQRRNDLHRAALKRNTKRTPQSPA